MAAYVIANIDVKDPVRYQDYIKMSPVSIAKFGGRFVARGGKTEVLEGDVGAEAPRAAGVPLR